MSRPNGARKYYCRYCKQMYGRTNFMTRRNGQLGFDGKRLSDTHLIACERRHQPAAASTPGKTEVGS